jgi:sigma-B regulation protein RsbU (phosphoserine phosphatase)
MKSYRVVVVAAAPHAARAAALRDRLASAWRGRTPIEIAPATFDVLEEPRVGALHAVVMLVHPDDRPSVVRAHLAGFDEAGVAAMVVLAGAPGSEPPIARPGTLIVRSDDDDAALAATLRGVLHRQREVERVRAELSLAQRFHGGLEGEMARMHDELQLAAMVQREFLPRALPALHGVEFAALWRPAHYVSGDIYDVARLDDDHVGVFIADAVGHGVPAALMTMVICRSLTTKIIDGNSYRLVEPSEVLDRLNRDLVRRSGGSTRFATGAYALIDCRSRRMRLAGAGHPPPILLRGGTGRELETQGGLLGVFENETYDQIDVELAVGDRLLMYSDGFEQAFPTQEASDYERRLPNRRYRGEFTSVAAELDPGTMIQVISRRLDDQRGSLHQIDDLTLVCMQANRLEAADARTTESRAASASNLAA